jgi:hypothetical protein
VGRLALVFAVTYLATAVIYDVVMALAADNRAPDRFNTA